MKRFLLPTIIAIVALAASSAAGAQELVKNGGFESGPAGGLPASWRSDEWTAGSTEFAIVPGSGPDGSAAFMIRSDDDDDAKLIQRVAVEPKSLYRASVRVKASGIPLTGNPPLKGAYISVLGVVAGSTSAYDTGDGWVDLVFYGKTGPKQRSLELALRLGGYSSLNRGLAYYDQVSFKKVESLPAGQEAQELFSRPAPAVPSGKGGGALPLILYAAAILIIWTAGRAGSRPAALLERARDMGASDIASVVMLAIAGLAVRIPSALGGGEYPSDLGTFMAWADGAFQSKIMFFYNGDSFADYPPLYIAILGMLSGLRRLFQVPWYSPAGHIIIRLPALLSDFALAWILYRFAGRRRGRGMGFLAASLLLLAPAMIWNSAVWAQVDSLFSLLIVLAVLALGARRWIASGIFYGLAALMKPQAFIFAPVWIALSAVDAFLPRFSPGPGAPEKGSPLLSRLKGSLSCLASILATLFVGWLPFMIASGLSLPFRLYGGTLASYPYLTLNAANLWALLGLNYAEQRRTLGAGSMSLGSLSPLIIVAVTLAAFGLFAWQAVRAARSKRVGALPGVGDSGFDAERLVLALASFIIFAVFLFAQKMHERYLLPFLPLALAWAVLDGRKASLLLAAAVGALHYLNIEQILSLARKKITVIPVGDPLFLTVSALSIVAFLAFALLLAFRPRTLARAAPEAGAKEGPGGTGFLSRFLDPGAFPGKDEKMDGGLLRSSAVVVAVATILCLAAGLWRLGDLKVPSRGWKSSHASQAVSLDLGEARSVAAVSWYSGIGDASYALSGSTDGSSWTELGTFASSLYCWRPLLLPPGTLTRWLRIEATSTGGTILEFAAWDEARRLLPLSPAMGEAAPLVDEQGLARRDASYMDSMYFDEIYHARTALEYMKGMTAYEWTHPPLGKLIIGVGIRIFGMGPFGWRFMGALFGALLVPLIWILALQVFPRGHLATGAALLYAADGMRIVQSRIGTVDTFTVGFLFLTFIFMYRWYLAARPRSGAADDRGSGGEAFRTALWALPLSGLSFGLAAATKWNALYVAPALALVFFAAFIPALRSDLAAAAAPEGKGKRHRDAADRARRRTITQALLTVGLCVVAFIIIPLAVYALSYVPTLKAPGKDWQSVWDLQKQMYGYHANLKAEHAFASPWWAWSPMIRPLWYFKGEGLPSGLVSTIVALGNPLTWWPSALAFLLAGLLAAARRDLRFLPVPLSFFFLYLPWVGISRLAFIYHYFPIFPFGLLSVLYCLAALMPPRAGAVPAASGKGFWQRVVSALGRGTGSWAFLYALAAIAMAVFFWPALTGFPVKEAWIRALHWMPTWIF